MGEILSNINTSQWKHDLKQGFNYQLYLSTPSHGGCSRPADGKEG